jgi:hypothetical protein
MLSNTAEEFNSLSGLDRKWRPLYSTIVTTQVCVALHSLSLHPYSAVGHCGALGHLAKLGV